MTPNDDTPVDVTLDRIARPVTHARVLVGSAVTVVVTVATAAVWGRTRASQEYVDAAVAVEARTNVALHTDLTAQRTKDAEKLAEICANSKAMGEKIDALRDDIRELRGHMMKGNSR